MMKFTFPTLIALLTVASTVSGCGQDTSVEDTTPPELACTGGFDSGLTDPVQSFDNLEEGRYCEVLVIYAQEDGTLLGDVYNSLAFGSCPQEIWDTLDANTIQEDFPDALFVMLNGPRYFVLQHLMDSPSQAQSPVLHDFGGILMAKAVTVVADMKAQSGYKPVTVNRDNTWRFEKGNRVHELIDADGDIYTMQSFARIVDKDLSYDDLETLGDRLTLPEGWSYRTRILDIDLDVQAVGTATVLQDELKNTYQWRSDCQITL